MTKTTLKKWNLNDEGGKDPKEKPQTDYLPRTSEYRTCSRSLKCACLMP